MVKRQARESIEAQKHQMIAALYANSAFDESDKGQEARAAQIKRIEKHFSRAIELVYDPTSKDPEEEESIDWNNPFWAAARRAKQRRDEIVSAQHAGKNVQEVVEMDAEQLKARAASRREIDQL